MDASELFLGIVSVGGWVIAFMVTRAINRIDNTFVEHGKRFDKHEEDISRLKVDVKEAKSSSESTAEMVRHNWESVTEMFRQVRHDVRDFKQSTTGQLQEIMKILMKADK